MKEYSYNLPRELIAQYIEPKDKHRLLVYNNSNKEIKHEMFKHIDKYFRSGDVIVVNRTKVYPAKIEAVKETGGKVIILLTKKLEDNKWQCIIEGKTKQGNIIIIPNNKAKLIERDPENYKFVLNFDKPIDYKYLDKVGKTPLPPYIKGDAPLSDYQTLFAKDVGSVAAPTAGFHFSKTLIDKLKDKGVKFGEVCLHVGIGTFAEIKEDNYKNHKIHTEEYEIDEKNCKIINNAKRIFVVGTTTMRVLETVADDKGKVKPSKGKTNIYIYPGYKYKMKFTGFITNFHLPKTTLLLMVATITGREELMRIYNEAIKEMYRFYSFGDGMMILKV